MPTVAAVVVLNFNDAAATLRCVDSVVREPGVGTVIVVDNGSAPQDVADLRAALSAYAKHVRLVESEMNLGFGAGMNLGIAEALGDEPAGILLLNNDTTVEAGTIQSLLDVLAGDAAIGIAVPVVTTGPAGDRIWAAGGSVDPRSLKVEHQLAGASADAAPADLDVSFAPGAALLVRPDVLRALGGFVEEFFLYCEDVELSLRVRDAGWHIRLVPGARVWHAVQGGRPQRTLHSLYYRTRNAIWLARSRGAAGWLLIAVLTVLRGMKMSALLSGRSPRRFVSGVGHVGRGLVDGLRRSPDLRARTF